jgi:plasmid stability protein
MANLTITVNDDALRRARSRAALEGRSVNALLKEVLEAYSGTDRDRHAAVEDLLTHSKSTPSRSGHCKWTRDELHERHG